MSELETVLEAMKKLGDDPAVRASVSARVRLANFQPHSQTNAHGKGAVLFGLAFAAAGSVPLLTALDVIHSPDSSFNAPRWFVAGISILFFVLPGLSLVVHGLRGVRRERRRREMLAAHPDQPWLGDHAWQTDGEVRSGWSAVGKRFLQIVALSAFLAPFHWIALREEGVRLFLLFVALFDLIVLGLIISWMLLVVRALRYGRTRLVYERFPVHPGESLDLRFEMSRQRSFDRLTFHLLCVEDEYAGGGKHAKIVPWQLLEMEQVRDGEATAPDGMGGVAVSFAIPADAPGSKLGVRPPRYWALIVRGEAPGADYHERFLVPVYARFADEALARIP